MRLEKFGDYIDVSRGASLSGTNYSETGEFIRLTLGNFLDRRGFKSNTSKKDIYYIGSFSKEYLLKKGDIITPLTEQTFGLLGSTARIPDDNLYIQSQDTGLVKCKEGLLPNYCYYLLSSDFVRNQISAAAQQTKIRHTSPDKISSVKVIIPDIKYQKITGDLLSTIEEKININKNMIEKIENICTDLYIKKFENIDYYKKNSSLPFNWKKIKLDELVTSVSGYPFSSSDYVSDGKYKIYTIKNVQDNGVVSKVDNYINSIPDNMDINCKLNSGDLIMSLTGNVGRVGLVFENNALLNQRVLKLIPHDNIDSFIYITLKRPHNRYKIEQLAGGTSQKNLSPLDLLKLNIILPSDTELKEYCNICNKLIKMECDLLEENEILSKKIENLIPLVINQQLKLKEVE